MTTVYVAAPWTHRVFAAAFANMLPFPQYRHLHSWWSDDPREGDIAGWIKCAVSDLMASSSCDIFILLNLDKSEGKSVETGLALARYERGESVRMLGCGPRYTNVFQYLPVWEWHDTPELLLAAL